MSMLFTTGASHVVNTDPTLAAEQPDLVMDSGKASEAKDGAAGKPKKSSAAKASIAAALLCTVAVILVEVLGFSSVLSEETANLIALPLLATAALSGGIQSYFRSQTVRSALSAAVFQFVAAAILYACSLAVMLFRLLIA